MSYLRRGFGGGGLCASTLLEVASVPSACLLTKYSSMIFDLSMGSWAESIV